MNELLAAAKAVIDQYDYTGTEEECEAVNRLYEAVERTENLPTDFYKWWEQQNEWHCYKGIASKSWIAAKQAERQRIKEIIKYQFGDLVSDLSDVMEMIDERTDSSRKVRY